MNYCGQFLGLLTAECGFSAMAKKSSRLFGPGTPPIVVSRPGENARCRTIAE
jgi:hypothetical protein